MRLRQRPEGKTFSLVMSISLFWLIATCQSALSDLVAKCGQDCAARCDGVKDFGPGGLQQCYRNCVKICPRYVSSGVSYPKFHVLTLMYAPPGCATGPTSRCSSSSSVEYLSGSSTGSRISLQSSFKEGTDLSLSASYSYEGVLGLGFSDSSGWTTTKTSTSTQTISKSASNMIRVPAGGGDGIDHSQDQIIVLLNPAFTVSTYRKQTEWLFGYKAPSAELYTLYVQWLTNPASMPPNVAALLKSKGIDEQDFKTILSSNPFAYGPGAIDSNRYARLTTTFPYEPPQKSAKCTDGICSCATFSQIIKNDFQTERMSQYQWQYTEGDTKSGSLSFANIKSADSQTITVTSSETSIQSSTNSATVTITCPSADYTGPTLMAVYWDTLFGTFMFAPVEADPGLVLIHRGRVQTFSSEPAQHQEVTLMLGRKIYRTYTNNNGEYQFYSEEVLPDGFIGRLNTGGLSKVVNIGDPLPIAVQLRKTGLPK
jgi:hypothetical protein